MENQKFQTGNTIEDPIVLNNSDADMETMNENENTPVAPPAPTINNHISDEDSEDEVYILSDSEDYHLPFIKDDDDTLESQNNYEYADASGDEMEGVLTNTNGTDYFNKICYF
uniref:Uncharacterized protein n=1 Tax=Strongyloides papillosus TaxID=174720 RepID=A0A0N5BTN2_STREA